MKFRVCLIRKWICCYDANTQAKKKKYNKNKNKNKNETITEIRFSPFFFPIGKHCLSQLKGRWCGMEWT